MILPVSGPPLKDGILEFDDDGTITGIYTRPEQEKGIEFFEGVLIPGLVNVHCHLELSYLQGKITSGTGLGRFIGEINKQRNTYGENPMSAIEAADHEMLTNGIVAAGDISNTLLSLDAKLDSSVYYHTFAETFGFLPGRAERAFSLAENVYNTFRENNLPVSIVPHSPYSVSEPLFRKIIGHAIENNGILSMHNQESMGENQFFHDGTGPIANHLKENIGLDISDWKPTGKNSVVSVLKYVPAANRLILVHNTHTNSSDLCFIKENRSMDNTFFCICPNSNLYIGNELPDLPLFRKEKINICIGTDSLASNNRLSVLSEMITLQKRFNDVPLTELLLWACLNGARALGTEHQFGSFETGKKPGINLLSNIHPEKLLLHSESRISRIA